VRPLEREPRRSSRSTRRRQERRTHRTDTAGLLRTSRHLLAGRPRCYVRHRTESIDSVVSMSWVEGNSAGSLSSEEGQSGSLEIVSLVQVARMSGHRRTRRCLRLQSIARSHTIEIARDVLVHLVVIESRSNRPHSDSRPATCTSRQSSEPSVPTGIETGDAPSCGGAICVGVRCQRQFRRSERNSR